MIVWYDASTMVRVIVSLSVGLVVACSGGAATEIDPTISANPESNSESTAQPTTSTPVPTDEPTTVVFTSAATTAAPILVDARELTACITSLAFAASFHEHRIALPGGDHEHDLFGYDQFGTGRSAIEAAVGDPILRSSWTYFPPFLHIKTDVSEAVTAPCEDFLDLSIWEQLQEEFRPTR